jgi:hypothetical protein
MMDYFLIRQGITYGPYSIAQMQTFVAEGRVQLSDFARTETMVQWQPLQAIWTQAPVVWTPAPPPAPVPQYAAAMPVLAPVPTPTRGNLLTWPFHQRSWFESLWMPLLWWFPVPLLPLGALLSIGWSIDAARRWSSKAGDLLPRPDGFGRMFRDGLTVAFFSCFYFLVPVTLAWMATTLSATSFLMPALQWGWGYLHGIRTLGLADVVSGVFVSYLMQRAVILLYLVLGWPLFTAGAIRFVLSRQATSFFHLPACVGLLFRHFGAFVKFLLLTALAAIAITIADALAASTGVGAPLVIPMGAAGVWTMSYLFANLAARVAPSVQASTAGTC